MFTWLHRLFGKWQVIGKIQVTLKRESLIFNKQWQDHGFFIIERNSGTGEERAYFEDINGKKETVSLNYAKSFL